MFRGSPEGSGWHGRQRHSPPRHAKRPGGVCLEAKDVFECVGADAE